MELSKEQAEGVDYFDKRYQVICSFPLVAKKPIVFTDSKSARICRFCGLSKPDVTFRKKAHAVPEFLGNKALVSMNECDVCNEFLADNCEDHLAKWFGLGRAVAQIKGKTGVPTYKADGLRIEMGPTGLQMSVVDEANAMGICEDGPFTLTLPLTASQPFIPLRAAKAFVKIACSVLPHKELTECKGAIDWIMGRVEAKFSNFPVLFAFTPGPNPYNIGMVLLLRRKTNDQIPYFCSIVAAANYRFQFFVPFCPSDAWLTSGKDTPLLWRHFPVPFGKDWKHGETKFSVINLSSSETTVIKPSVTFHVDQAIQVVGKSDDDGES